MRKLNKIVIGEILNDQVHVEDETGTPSVLPLSALPANIKEQDWLVLEEDGSYKIDDSMTELKKQSNSDLYKKLKGESREF